MKVLHENSIQSRVSSLNPIQSKTLNLFHANQSKSMIVVQSQSLDVSLVDDDVKRLHRIQPSSLGDVRGVRKNCDCALSEVDFSMSSIESSSSSSSENDSLIHTDDDDTSRVNFHEKSVLELHPDSSSESDQSLDDIESGDWVRERIEIDGNNRKRKNRKNIVYGGDNYDYELMDEEEQKNVLEEEENEVKKAELNVFKDLQDGDFGDVEELKRLIQKKNNKNDTLSGGNVEIFDGKVNDLMSISEKESYVMKNEPELTELVGEFNEKKSILMKLEAEMNEIHKNQRIKSEQMMKKRGMMSVEMRYYVYSMYCENILLYLMLKNDGMLDYVLNSHPVVKRLVELTSLVSKMEAFDERLWNVLDESEDEEERGVEEEEEIVQKKAKMNREKKENVREKDEEREKEEENEETREKIEDEEYLEMMFGGIQGGKEEGNSGEEMGDSDEESFGEEVEEEDGKSEEKIEKEEGKVKKNGVEGDGGVVKKKRSGRKVLEEGSVRLISSEILKNRGLTPRRRSKKSKEKKNPRTKHRMKFEKAVSNQRGYKRQYNSANGSSRYTGEISGINPNAKHSTKL